jgi:hypothetical protein
MRSVRETYDLPESPPSPVRMWVFMVTVALGAVVLWLVLPDSAVTVAILAVVLLAVVFFGVSRILKTRGLSEPPGRRPTPPPSTQ